MKNNAFMKIALERAFNQIGVTSPNPPVGAVLVKNGTIISSGGTQVCGGDHAEICAIKQAGENTVGSELYVTLEPCCHHGKTPPCTDAIISAGIKKVYIPLLDVNPAVAGKGVQKLREGGVEVEIFSEFHNDALSLVKPFFKRITDKSSYVIHKSAFTVDGKTADSYGNSKWISNTSSRIITHRLRSLSDAIIIGKNTYVKDHPKLNVRLDDFDDSLKLDNSKIIGSDNFFYKMLLSNEWGNKKKTLMKVVIGLPDITNKELFDDNEYLIYEYVSKINNSINIKNLIAVENNDNMINFILSDLSMRGYYLVMFEGGSTIAGEFYNLNNIDEVLYMITPKILKSGFPVINSGINNSIENIMNISDISVCMLDNDILYHGYLE